MVFLRATQAVAAAVQIQRALATESWPSGGAVQVRIGIHTGEPIRTTEGYTGLDVIRATRIKEAGHGGQVLLSASTTAIVQDACSIRDAVKVLEIEVRIGVHAGEVEHEEESPIGITVHIGARVTS